MSGFGSNVMGENFQQHLKKYHKYLNKNFFVRCDEFYQEQWA